MSRSYQDALTYIGYRFVCVYAMKKTVYCLFLRFSPRFNFKLPINHTIISFAHAYIYVKPIQSPLAFIVTLVRMQVCLSVRPKSCLSYYSLRWRCLKLSQMISRHVGGDRKGTIFLSEVLALEGVLYFCDKSY